MIKKKSLFLGVLAMLLGTALSYGQTFYVRAGAGGNGSDWANAYSSLPSTLVRGATYYVATGTYGGYTFQTAASGTALVTIKKATVADHGTSTGWNDNYGTGTALFQGQFQVNGNYFVLDGQTGGGPGSWTNGFGFKIKSPASDTFYPVVWIREGASQVTFKHVEIEGQGYGHKPYGGGAWANDAMDIGFSQNGSASQPASYVTVSYAYLHDAGRCLFFGAVNHLMVDHVYGGKYTYHDDAHAEICSFYAHVQSGAPGPVCTDLNFAHCVFSHIEGSGGLMVQTDSLNVYGCVFYRPTGSTFSQGNGVIATWGSDVLTHARIYNNSFINLGNDTSGGPMQAFGIWRAGTATDNIAKNNLFYNCGVDFGGISSHDYNMFINTSGSGASSEAHGASGSSSIFNNYLGLDFTLNANTPAGTDLGAPYNVDARGVTRTTWTRGAYEFGVSATPVLQVSTTSLSFGSVNLNTTNLLTLTVKNVGGGTLSGTASVPAPFRIVSGGSYSLSGGQSQTVTVGYVPTVAGNASQTITFTGGGGATVSVSALAVAVVNNGLNFLASDGVISLPFSLVSGVVSQLLPADTPLLGGRATYNFTVTNAGQYVVQALVNAPSTEENSFWVNIDAMPQDPIMIWDPPVTSGFQWQTVAWRGATGNSEADADSPHVFNLGAGTHQLIVIGREANTQLSAISIVPYVAPRPVPPPAPTGLRVVSQ